MEVGGRRQDASIGHPDTPWMQGPDIAYTWTDWQVGRVTGLEPGTRYEFDISVYRRWWPGGETFEHQNRANGNTVRPGPLTATTLTGIPDIPPEVPQTTEHIQTYTTTGITLTHVHKVTSNCKATSM